MTDAKLKPDRVKKTASMKHPRGQGHPCTAQITYTPREWEFMKAVEDWKRTNNRQFPLLSDLLRVVDTLGYRKPEPEPIYRDPPKTCPR